MGQTLTHGVYLPDEGERNCYDGLASNWSILDGAVGTVAEHTTQIAGKAPAVHTHTKSDITDFPAYGTTAGTICEGNDSRLSDARTPTSHVHGNISNDGKLTNGNRAVITGSDKAITESSVTDTELGYLSGVTSAIQTQFDSKAGLSANNTFSGSNSFYSGLTINNAALLSAVLPNAVKGDVSTTGDFAIFIKDKVNSNAATSLLAIYRGGQDSGGSYAQINIDTKGNDNNRYNNSISFRINPADNSNNAVLIPQRDSTIDLGTSTNRWKTLNGINPGALSLPNLDTTYRQSVDTTDWVLDGSSANSFTPSVSGWLNIRITDAVGNYIFMQSRAVSVSNQSTGSLPSSVSRPLSALIPVIAGEPVSVLVQTTSIVGFIYPCLGNV